MSGEILTVAEVAQLLKVAEKTVYTMAQNAELPCFKVRGQWRCRRQDLDTWIAAQVAGAAGADIATPKRQSPAKNGACK